MIGIIFISILTFDEAKKLGREKTAAFESADLSSFIKRADVTDVFLSHSSKDNDVLPGIVNLLNDHGASVYIDNGDSRLPSIPSPQTAVILKSAIRKCPRFVILVSPNSRNSRWVPWEIGLADGIKGMPCVASLPINKTAELPFWANQEYLAIYPRIERVILKGKLSSEWCVHDITTC